MIYSTTFFKIFPIYFGNLKIRKVTDRVAYNNRMVVFSISTCISSCKYNYYMGQIHLRQWTYPIAVCKAHWRVWKSHVLKYLYVFLSLLEFQLPPIFLPIELSYCIIAMHLNGSFPPIVFPKSFAPIDNKPLAKNFFPTPEKILPVPKKILPTPKWLIR